LKLLAGSELLRTPFRETDWKLRPDMMMAYALRHGDHQIPHGSLRRRMALRLPASSRTHQRRTPQAARLLEGDPPRRLLRTKERLPVAAFAPRVPALEDGLRLVQEVALREGTWERLNAELRERLRCRLGRDPNPSAGIVDSQSARTSGVGGQERGFDPAKMVEGRKRHLLVDTEGLVLKALPYTAPGSPMRMASGCCWGRHESGSRASRASRICGLMPATRVGAL
jgi:transposase